MDRYAHGNQLIMQSLGLSYQQLHINANYESTPERGSKDSIPIQIVVDNLGVAQLKIGTSIAEMRKAKNPEKVPKPLFHENALQTILLQEMLRTYSSGIPAMLLIGNQGVGKNKLVDRLLELLNAEREYVQLHRDTTVQSLTVLPHLIDGKIVYEDSPMVRAAKEGTILVIDEADKAPLEVVCLLKMLVEDGELLLHDGRRLLTAERKAALSHSELESDVIQIHKDFRLIALANRPGFPFHGNNFFRECGDVLTTHVIDNLDTASEIELLKAYGPNVSEDILKKLALSFQDLRAAHASGKLTYPFSAREAVAVVKHIQAFPQDGAAAAVEDFLSFEDATPKSRRILAEIFQARGIPVPVEIPSSGTLGVNLLHNSIQMAAPSIVPSPIRYPLVLKELSLAAALGYKVTKTSPWKTTETLTQAYSIESTRLNTFRF